MTRWPRLAGNFAAVVLAGCGRGSQDLSYPNDLWRSTVDPVVSFPLAEPMTLRVGLGRGMGAPAPDSATLAWLERETNIRLEFVGGDGLDLQALIPSGRLPDIVPEGAFDLGEASVGKLFVDILEFPGLTPHFRQVVASAPRFRDGLLARWSEGDALYSMGTYDPDWLPFAGVLAYRQDLFEARGLETGSWASIRHSLQELKSAFPESYPFGESFDAIMTMMPSWFGSGYDRRDIVYFDDDSGQWKFGPYEDQFREMVFYLTDLYRQGLLFPDMMTLQILAPRDFSGVFMTPYAGLTGPAIRFPGSYGELTPEGQWNGEGAWVSSLPLPPPPLGGTAKMSAQRFSAVGYGWLAYNQSKHVAEAVALLDFMFTDRAARVLALGPEGTVWRESGSRMELLEPYGGAYRDGGAGVLAERMRAGGIETAFPVRGLVFGLAKAFGQPGNAASRYHLLHDAATNRLGVDISAETGLHIPYNDREFTRRRVELVVALQTLIESGVAGFILGHRDLDQYDAFKEELREAGADRLLELFREYCTLGDPKVFDGK